MSLGARSQVSFAASVIAICLALIIGSPALASHFSGIKVTFTERDFVNYSVDVDITLLAESSSPTSYSYTYLGNGANPAIDWGDGSTDSSGTVYGVTGETFPGAPTGTGVYRGSFSHTYADPGSYTITAYSNCCAVSSSTYVLTGNWNYPVTYYSSSVSTYFTITTVSNTAQAVFPPPSFFSQNSSCGMGAELVAILPPLILWRSRRRRSSARRA